MRYRFPNLPPELLPKALAAGKLDSSHMFIELPDDFDFGGIEPPKPVIGLGDRFASIAQPIARVIDATLGTDIQNCGGCAKRKEFLNNL